MAKETLYRKGVDGTEPLYPLTTSDQVLVGEITLDAKLALLLAIASVVNNLTTGGTAVPLSAEQGKIIKGMIDDLTLADIATSTAGVDAQEAMDAKQGRLTLLWTNASPGSSFAAQTVSLDLTAYDFVVIFLSTSTSTAGQARMADNGRTVKGYGGYLGTAFKSDNYTRDILGVSDSGVTFAGGYINATTGDQYAIPRYIYGGNF